MSVSEVVLDLFEHFYVNVKESACVRMSETVYASACVTPGRL